MAGIASDILYAGRMFRRNPVFALAIVLLLSLGIGSNTAIFTAIDVLLLRPLPIKNPGSLVHAVYTRPVLGTRDQFPYEFLKLLRSRSTKLADVFGQSEQNLAVVDGALTERIRAHIVTGNFFPSLGVQALHGRSLTPEDEWGASDTLPAVLGFPFWMRHFNGGMSIIGKTLLVGGYRFVIVGVMPEQFHGAAVETCPEIWLPLISRAIVISDSEQRKIENGYFQVFGRLRPNATLLQAGAETLGIWRAAMEADFSRHPDISPKQREFELSAPARLESARNGVSRLRPQFSSALVFLMCAFGLLLGMVCANVAGLLLARASGRQREIAVRIAMGATRARLVRQMLTEGLLLTLFGAVGAFFVAYLSLKLLVRALPPVRLLDATRVPLVLNFHPDLKILGFALAVCILTCLLFGLAPALQATRVEVHSALQSVRSSTRWRGRQLLLMLQIALCTVLLCAAGLLVSTFQKLRSADTGFDRDHVVTFSLDPTLRGYNGDQARLLEERLLEKVRSLPGVQSAAFASRGLMRGTGLKGTFAPTGQRITNADFLNASINSVTPEYFTTMGMRITAGRLFTVRDSRGVKPAPVIVNRAFIRHFFPETEPVGRTFGSGIGSVAKADNLIIGIVSDAKYRSLREPFVPTIYEILSSGNQWLDEVILHVRTRQQPEQIIGPVRQILRSLDPRLPFAEVDTLREEVDASLWGERLLASLASAFGALAAILAAVGIYGLLAYTVAQRTREIGIRMALGARPKNIVQWLSSRLFKMVIAGVAIGLAASLIIGPSIRSLLYGIVPFDPVTLGLAVLFILAIAAAATAVPAMRAVRIEPSPALRQE